jgi:antitoxin (DNA-binding transcriptional repressor) of toxin-antitoxin stability system
MSDIRDSPSEYRVTRRLSATEAARTFSDLLNRARYRGESFVIERGGVAIAELRPVAPPRFTGRDLVALLRNLPAVDEGFLSAVEDAANRQPQLPDSPWER